MKETEKQFTPASSEHKLRSVAPEPGKESMHSALRRMYPEECSARSMRKCWKDWIAPTHLLSGRRTPFAATAIRPCDAERRMQNRSASPMSVMRSTSASVVAERPIGLKRKEARSEESATHDKSDVEEEDP